MASAEESTYEVSHVSAVVEQIRELTKKARQAGIQSEFVGAIEAIMEELKMRPLKWGDPEYHPKKPGSCVCHGIRDPLFVQYAVYEPERKVLLLKIKPLPSSPLA